MTEPIAPLPLARALVFAPLLASLKEYEWRTSATDSGEAVLTFISGRRYAILTADSDCDLVLTLTDRDTNNEAIAEVVTAEVEILATSIRRFLVS